jgi:hypothetical protein
MAALLSNQSWTDGEETSSEFSSERAISPWSDGNEQDQPLLSDILSFNNDDAVTLAVDRLKGEVWFSQQTNNLCAQVMENLSSPYVMAHIPVYVNIQGFSLCNVFVVLILMLLSFVLNRRRY